MPNKMTVALTRKPYEEIIKTMHEGGAGFRKNPWIATALVLAANLGLRIKDILELRLLDGLWMAHATHKPSFLI